MFITDGFKYSLLHSGYWPDSSRMTGAKVPTNPVRHLANDATIPVTDTPG
jgi:hypothetical protein